MATGLDFITVNLSLKFPDRIQADNTSIAVMEPADVLKGNAKAKSISNGDEISPAFLLIEFIILGDCMYMW